MKILTLPLNASRRSQGLRRAIALCNSIWHFPFSIFSLLPPFFHLQINPLYIRTRWYAAMPFLSIIAQMIQQKNIGCRWSSSVFATDGDQWQTPIWHENQWPVGCQRKKTDEYQRQPMFFCNIIWAKEREGEYICILPCHYLFDTFPTQHPRDLINSNQPDVSTLSSGRLDMPPTLATVEIA